jgi:hypothetical protein
MRFVFVYSLRAGFWCSFGVASWTWDLDSNETFSGSTTPAYSCFAGYRYALLPQAIWYGLTASASTHDFSAVASSIE